MKRPLMYLLSGLAAVLVLAGCSSKTHITAVTLDLPQTMERGSSVCAVPEYTYSGDTPDPAAAEELAAGLGLTYSSSDPGVVAVDAKGNLTAIGAGTAEISVSSEDGTLSASDVVTVVVSPTGIAMPEEITITEGEKAYPAAATVLPEDAAGFSVVYASSDDSVVSVDDTGMVTAVAAGEADITASIEEEELRAVCHVVVVPAVTSLTLSADTLTLNTGDTETLRVIVDPEGADASAVVWASSSDTVATVDGQGTVTAVGSGEAVITAALGNVQASCSVSVSGKPDPAPESGDFGNSGGSEGAGKSEESGSQTGSGSSSEPASGSPSTPASGTQYGEVPFDLAAGTGTWWAIDSTDSAYRAVLDNINSYRTAVGAAPLTADAALTSIATQRCGELVDTGLTHEGSQTVEIIGQNAPSAQSIVNAWANSTDHYNAMVSTQFTKCGIGCYFNEYGLTYWCVTLA